MMLHNIWRKAEAEVMPSSSLVEFEVEIRVEVEVGVEDEVDVGVRVEVEVGGSGLGFLVVMFTTFTGGWVGGVEKSRIELTSAKLG